RFFPTAEVRLYGRVTYDETSVARITAYFPGRIDRLFVNYMGVSIAKGDHIAEIFSPELLAAFEELRQAKRSAEAIDAASEFVRQTTTDTLEAAREKLRLFGLLPEQIRAIEDGTFQSDRLTIYSPIGGVVTTLSAREGDYLNTGEPIATVADLSRLWVDMEAYESQLPLLRWGQDVTFTVEAHPGEVFSGRISFIEPIVNEKTRTAAVRVAVDNADGHLKPGMFASAVVHAKVAADGVILSNSLAGKWVGPMHPTSISDAPGSCEICGMDLVRAESLGVVSDPTSTVAPLVIPRSAVLFTGKRSVVYVALPEADSPTYEAKEVVLGLRAGEWYVVRSGLREGEEVVTRGAFRIDSAMQIQAKASMMMPGDNPDADSDQDMDPNMDMSAQAEPMNHAVAASLSPLYEAYLDGQDALAARDVSAYLPAFEAIRSAIDNIDTGGLSDADRSFWNESVDQILGVSKPETLEQARTGFEPISSAIITIERRFGHIGDETWNVTFCPMAFDNAGASWLQRGSTVKNPYMNMPRCGEFQDERRPMPASMTPTTTDTTGEHTHD
ncbi:MAG TPA: DUF3347 domain-containing protein, partial [Phycisphaerales bacterium]|nr:DUF3347 domain-containing protein [Phycisphaerales bacterium]